MHIVRNTGAALRRWALAAVIATGAVATADTSTLVELDRGEPFEAMVVHANHLWVGQSRSQFNADYRIQVFDTAGKKVAETKLKHAVGFLYAYGPSTVMAVGTAHTPNLTHFTLLTLAGGKVTAKTTQVPVNAWAHQWIGTYGGVEHFIDFSGNSNDPEAENNFNLPAQTIFTMNRGRAKYLPIRLRAPRMGKKVGELAYVLRAYSIGHPGTNIAVVDVAKRQVRNLFETAWNGARDFVALDGGKTLAVSVQGDEAVRFVDATNGAVKSEIAVDGGPASMAELGQCVLVGTEGKKDVVAIRRNAEGQATVAARVDLSGTGATFRALKKIAVNPSTGVVYGRSAYACNPLTEDCSQLWNSVVATDAATGAKLLEACR